MKTRTILLLLSLIGIFSCKKKDEKKPVYINQTLNDWFDYKVGSYWIFYDSLNNAVDSLYVDHARRIAPFDHTADEREFNSIVSFLFNMTTNRVESRWSILALASSNLELMVDIPQVDSEKLHYTIIRAIPFESKVASHYECTQLPEYTVNGNLYKNVYRVYLHDTAFGTFYDNMYYIDREAGFISIIHNSSTFKQRLSLLRCKVLK